MMTGSQMLESPEMLKLMLAFLSMCLLSLFFATSYISHKMFLSNYKETKNDLELIGFADVFLYFLTVICLLAYFTL